jgi:hypothetical protein
MTSCITTANFSTDAAGNSDTMRLISDHIHPQMCNVKGALKTSFIGAIAVNHVDFFNSYNFS